MRHRKTETAWSPLRVDSESITLMEAENRTVAKKLFLFLNNIELWWSLRPLSWVISSKIPPDLHLHLTHDTSWTPSGWGGGSLWLSWPMSCGRKWQVTPAERLDARTRLSSHFLSTAVTRAGQNAGWVLQWVYQPGSQRKDYAKPLDGGSADFIWKGSAGHISFRSHNLLCFLF